MTERLTGTGEAPDPAADSFAFDSAAAQLGDDAKAAPAPAGEVDSVDVNATAETAPAGDVDSLDVTEAQAMIQFLGPLLEIEDELARREVLGKALMTFGIRILWTMGYLQEIAPDHMKEAVAALAEVATDAFTRWLAGEAFSDRADEDELRALAALDAVKAAGPQLVRLAAGAVMRLPPGNPVRNVAQLRESLTGRLASSRAGKLWLDYALIGETLLVEDLLERDDAKSLAEEMAALADREVLDGEPLEVEDRRRIYSSVADWQIQQALGERDSDAAAAESLLVAATANRAKAQALGTSVKDVLMEAIALDESGRSQEAADLLAGLPEQSLGTAAWVEGLIRLRLGQYRRAAEVLERVVPHEEEAYMHAIGNESTESDGERYGKDATNLAFAYAFLGEWSKAVDTIERAKSPRMRHAAKLRQSPAGKELLTLEARLASATRGVPDVQVETADREKNPLGARLSTVTRALEEYRRTRPDLDTAHLAPPTVAEVGALLTVDEAVVCMASSFKGLFIAIILPGDESEPSGRFLIEELPGHRLLDLMLVSDEISGWALELAALEPIDPQPSLDAFIAKSDAAFGVRIAEFLEAHRVRTVTILPHRVLHFTPFWALPSLARFDVRTARSLAHWHEARAERATLGSRACVVGNPTLDLPLATAEAESVKALLESRGCRAEVLLKGAAQEGPIRQATRGSGLLHFAGHGLSRPMHPLQSALLTHPDHKWGWPAAGDPLAAFARTAREWVASEDGSRYADVSAGRLVEHTDEEGGVVERRLEHAGSGTLWGHYYDGQLQQLAELWTTSDILTEDALVDCSVAFLVACQSGQPAFQTDLDEDLTLPGALQLAGVSSVVCALWPVDDVTGLIFSGVFYRGLVERKGEVDLAELVADSRSALSTMHRDQAAAILRETLEHTTGRATRAQLEFVIQALSSGPERPFAHPYHWAAFFTQGATRLEIPWT